MLLGEDTRAGAVWTSCPHVYYLDVRRSQTIREVEFPQIGFPGWFGHLWVRAALFVIVGRRGKKRRFLHQRGAKKTEVVQTRSKSYAWKKP